MGLVNERLTPVEVDLGAEREIANPVEDLDLVPDLSGLECGSIGPMCLATVHRDEAVCRPDDACWVFQGAALEHVSHGGVCWHETIFPLSVPEDVAARTPIESEEISEPALVRRIEQEESSPLPSDDFTRLRDGLYAKLREEGNPPQLSITLASLYAEWQISEIPETMAMLRQVGDSISGVLGGDQAPGGFVGKIVSHLMRGNG